MNKRSPAIAPALLLAGLLLGRAPAAAQDIEPEEPAIVLPEVILKTEDISVEQVEAGIPQDEEILPPEREAPLPEAGDLVIQEPPLELAPQEGEAILPLEREPPPLVAEGVLGAGSMNHIYSSISLFRVEDEPRFELKFLHEMLDGFIEEGLSGHDPGSGFNRREDSLAGSIRFHLGALEVKAEGSLQDLERGLQRRSPYASQIDRFSVLQAESILPVSGLWSFGAGVNTHVVSQLLTSPSAVGVDPDRAMELMVEPQAFGEVRSDQAWLRLGGRYRFRTLAEHPDFLLHRVSLGASAGINLPLQFRIEGDGAWFYSSDLGSLFPFSLSLSGAPVDPLAFTLRGGYRVQQLDLKEILQSFDMVARPTDLEDNRGWFGEAGLALNFSRSFILNGQAALSWNSAMPDIGTDPDPITGLFPYRKGDDLRLTSSLSLRWNPASMFSLRAGWESEWLTQPGFVPPVRIRLESDGMAPSGAWGWHASVVVWDWDGFQLPLLDMNGFYRVSEMIRLIVEVNDLLQPLQTVPRRITPPYEEPGIRGTVKVQITL
jgi:hypothetical protein